MIGWEKQMSHNNVITLKIYEQWISNMLLAVWTIPFFFEWFFSRFYFVLFVIKPRKKIMHLGIDI